MLFWRQGCLLFFELGQKPEIWGIPPNGAVTGSKQIGEKTRNMGNTPKGEVSRSKWVGVKQQKSGKYSKLEELHEA